MRNNLMLSCILALSALCCAAAWAQEGTDPFHPPERGPAAPSGEAVWGRDPFSNPFPEKTPVLRTGPARGAEKRGLTGIIYSKQARVAIIGGETLREGSMVGDKKLVDIRRRSVVFMNASGGYEEMTLEDFSIGGK